MLRNISFQIMVSGSAYIQVSSTECSIASKTLGDGPKLLLFTPNLAKNLISLLGSWASGPTKGTDDGKLSMALEYQIIRGQLLSTAPKHQIICSAPYSTPLALT